MDATGQPPTHETDSPSPQVPGDELPPGNSSVEIAARRGIGPLSPLGAQAWHGQSRPCVSCGQLVRRDATACPDCGEDLSADKIELMRAHAGPWYVHEHVRPFPGVKFDRLVRQIRRGVLTATTIVRGPTTDHQWRFAAETPGLSQHLGVCWNCQASVSTQDRACVGCGASLDMATAHVAPPIPGGNTLDGNNVQLAALSRAVRAVPPRPALEPEAPRLGKIHVSWVVAAIVVVLIAGLFAVVQMRNAGLGQASSESSAATSSLQRGPTVCLAVWLCGDRVAAGSFWAAAAVSTGGGGPANVYVEPSSFVHRAGPTRLGWLDEVGGIASGILMGDAQDERGAHPDHG